DNAPSETSRRIKLTQREVDLHLQLRFDTKMAQNDGLDYGGFFEPWVISAGGTMLQRTMKSLDMLKKAPSSYSEVTYKISAALMRFRSRVLMKCWMNKTIVNEQM